MFAVNIYTTGAAFENVEDEVARLLREVASTVASGSHGGTIHDINGQRVGDWHLDTDE